jgi:hypothetical protein
MNRLKLKKVVLRDLDDSQLHTLAGGTAGNTTQCTYVQACNSSYDVCPTSDGCPGPGAGTDVCFPTQGCPPPPPDTSPATCSGKTCDGHCC